MIGVNSYTLCNGYSGILYMFDFLRKQGFIDIDLNGAEIILENYILQKMREDIKKGNYDFLHGALGVGYYFQEKRHEKYVKELIDFLYDSAEKDFENRIFKWRSSLEDKGNIEYNISLSHGISSIVLFLSLAIKINIQHNKVRELIDGAVNYLLSQKIDHTKYGSFFPNSSIETSVIEGSRLAWCYGDLGIAFTLWKAGKIIGNIEWQEEGLFVLIASTNRKDRSETKVIDAGICHGSVGVAMIYRRMYLETNMDTFLEATNYWLKRAIGQADFSDGLAGYKSWLVNKWINDYSFITGISGIGLLFMSYIQNTPQDWDEMFLL